MAVRNFETIPDLKDHVGEEVGISDWFEVTQERVNIFADATDDYQWIHTDVERARRESPSKTTVAHGFLTLSLLAPLFATALHVGNTSASINYGLNRVRFTAPVLTGDRIRARFRLKEYTELDAGAQLIWDVTIERQGGTKPALVAEWIMRRIP